LPDARYEGVGRGKSRYAAHSRDKLHMHGGSKFSPSKFSIRQ
jgi:hypothetical protein